jgi:hypothetical protein
VRKHFAADGAASAIEAGNDTRTALVGFGVDGSHGYERTHESSLLSVAQLIGLFLQSPPPFARDDKDEVSTLNVFPPPAQAGRHPDQGLIPAKGRLRAGGAARQ